ncbi:DUF4156 domain-containing protein [Marinimicrobium agarilyticum]|uniref:DUF4156 domain-containing protein n=1 Tax=Marinimicrobium agarilyticum TaxID=306546 RepID=UPI0004040928|nr:DUF4156 domain-containing protein [Marinimicrobium agarilyticum]
MKKLSLLLLSACFAASACTWVNVSEKAEDVVVGTMGNVRGCEKLSDTNVSVADSLGPIARSEEKVAKELEAMGKNEAVELGGDTIVPKTEPKDGRQTFSIYNCQ